MADFYSSISKTANKLVNKFGKSIAIHRQIGGSFNSGTGAETGTTTDIQYIKSVVLPASGGKIAALDKRYNLGALTFQRLNYCIVSGEDLSWVPNPDDEIVISGETWKLIGLTPLNPNEGTTAITYEMAFRI